LGGSFIMPPVGLRPPGGTPGSQRASLPGSKGNNNSALMDAAPIAKPGLGSVDMLRLDNRIYVTVSNTEEANDVFNFTEN
jgi:hypothetical protein